MPDFPNHLQEARTLWDCPERDEFCADKTENKPPANLRYNYKTSRRICIYKILMRFDTLVTEF
jgi:hypothetical protein